MPLPESADTAEIGSSSTAENGLVINSFVAGLSNLPRRKESAAVGVEKQGKHQLRIVRGFSER